MVPVALPVAPCPVVSAAGESDRVYSGAALTVRVSGVERLPGVPVPSTVRLYTPGATAAPTLTVSVELVPVGAAGLNDPVTPVGAPPRLKVTAPAKLVRVMVTVELPVAPCPIVSAAGESDRVYSGAALTVRVSGVERLPGVPVPSTVRLYTPGATAAPTLTVSVELVPVGAAGLNDPVTPAGAVPRLRVTGPVKLVRVIVTADVPVAPCPIVSAAGESDRV